MIDCDDSDGRWGGREVERNWEGCDKNWILKQRVRGAN